MSNGFDPKRQLIILAILILIAFAIAIFFYIFFLRGYHKTPTRGFFVESKGVKIVCAHVRVPTIEKE